MSPLSASADARLGPRLSLKESVRRAWAKANFRDASVLVLLAANLLPMFGVLFWGWDLFLLLLLYWMETGVIGFWHFLRLGLVAKWFSLVLIPFFTVHFGGFMWGHLTFLMLLFGGGAEGLMRNGVTASLSSLFMDRGLWFPFFALFVSHGVSFYMNFWRPGLGSVSLVSMAGPGKSVEGFKDLMTAPYHRIVIMHVTILLGGVISMALHQPKGVIVLLVMLKTGIDLVLHVRKNAALSTTHAVTTRGRGMDQAGMGGDKESPEGPSVR